MLRPTSLALLSALSLVLSACDGEGGDSGGGGSGGAGNSTASTAAGISTTAAATTGTGLDPSCVDPVDHTGDGTYYDADGSGNCSFDPTGDLMVGAMNHTEYADSAVCGACVHITGPSGEATVKIVDQCPECKVGDIDLSPEAFSSWPTRAWGASPSTGSTCLATSPARSSITSRREQPVVDGGPDPELTLRDSQARVQERRPVRGGQSPRLQLLRGRLGDGPGALLVPGDRREGPGRRGHGHSLHRGG